MIYPGDLIEELVKLAKDNGRLANELEHTRTQLNAATARMAYLESHGGDPLGPFARSAIEGARGIKIDASHVNL